MAIYSQDLIDETINCFKEEDHLEISIEQAVEYLNGFADLYLSFTSDSALRPQRLSVGAERDVIKIEHGKI